MCRRAHLALLVVMICTVSVQPLAAADDHPVIKLVKSKVQDPAKPFALIVTFKVKKGNEKAFEEAFAPALLATRKEPG
jgi:hypothetical protein